MLERRIPYFTLNNIDTALNQSVKKKKMKFYRHTHTHTPVCTNRAIYNTDTL